ncbi:unnamed protein product [Chironomus riparius]|uniref:Sugar transporter n=1 Tax=Chironomus riparius TaxID=315576 RepID=A0A9N9S651_9DIPT|nr:unnamed protein product [Chironomus riparius]
MIIKIPWIAPSTQNQYFASILVSSLAVIHGCAIGWTSPIIPYLKSEDTHLNAGPITPQQASWIGACLSLGAVFSIVITGIAADYFGKKVCLIALSIPAVLFWTLTYVSTNVFHLYAARTVAGFCGGGQLRIVPLFIGELAESNVRGKLGAFFPLGLNLGIFLIFVIGTYIDYFIIPFVIFPFIVAYFVLMLFLPETPQYYLKKQKEEEALKSLKYYRNCNDKDSQNLENVQNELSALKKNIQSQGKFEVNLKDFVEKKSRRGLFISIFLVFIGAFSGNFTILTYTADIVKSAGSSFKPNEAAMIIAGVQFIGIYITSLYVDKFGRKVLMSISCVGSGLFLMLLATYSYVDTNYEYEGNLGWIPIFSLSMTILMNAFGICSLPFMIVTELVPQKIREATVMICMMLITLFAFINLKVYPPLVESISFYSCMYIYGGFCLLATFVIVFVMPETKGKNLFQN